MIVLDNVHKSYRTLTGTKHVLKGITCSIPRDVSLGILGRNGAGKSTLIRILSGTDLPDEGTIDFGGVRMSWPIGRGGAQSALTARDNVRFIARVQGIDIDEAVRFVADFTSLGEYMDMPVNTYSAGMRARLGFAMSMLGDYDCYLVDEGFSAGDANLAQRMSELFEERRQRSNMVVVTHSISIIKRFCDKAAILDKGHLTVYDDLQEAIRIYQNL